MSLSIGIIGLPNVGKSTLFKALTKNPVDISNYPFCTIEPNVGVVEVPDERLDKLAKISKSAKVVPAIIKFVDIAGLVKGANKGEGLGNQFLSHIREVDAIVQIVRLFKDEKISHVEGNLDVLRDIEIVKTELILKDLEGVEKRLAKIEKEAKGQNKEAVRELEVLEGIKERLDKNEPIFSYLKEIQDEEKIKVVDSLQLLSAKPEIYLFNSDNLEIPQDLRDKLEALNTSYLIVNLRDELDSSELTSQERTELEMSPPKLSELIKKSYEILNLITFFTIVGTNETRAWPIEKDKSILKAAFQVHTDFGEKFIKAEVINWQKLVEVEAWVQAREKGLVHIEGKDYIVQDGDVIEVKHGK